jgi:hypothetical protein
MTFQTRLRDSINRIRQQRGVTVTYSRLSDAVTLLATVGKTSQEEDVGTDSPAVVRTQIRDYIIAAADLVLSGATSQPQRGDRITEADGTVFEVLPLGSESWKYSDSGRTQFRIHTKQITNL